MAVAISPELDFDVRAVAREELAASSDPDPRAVVDAVFARIPRKAYPGVIRYLLARVLHNWSTQEDRSVRLEGSTEPGISRWAGSIYRLRVGLNPDGSEPGFLGELDREGCLRCAALRVAQAETLGRWAKFYFTLNDWLVERDLQRVCELDEAEVRGIMPS